MHLSFMQGKRDVWCDLARGVCSGDDAREGVYRVLLRCVLRR
jgi:hypothetical protein